MEKTTNLDLPYIMPSQAQKHVTHNEALLTLDAVVQLSVHDRNLTEPSGAEQDGERYIVADGATGDWQGWDGAIAARIDGEWRRILPGTGWIAWVEDEERFVYHGDGQWHQLGEALPALQDLELIGIGTTADEANPFAAKLNKALWSARYAGEGGDGNLRYTMNKEEPSGVLSLLMQSGWSGRAEVGLVGDDDLAIKVSPDGANWKEALRIDRTSGKASFPQTPAFAALSSLTGANGAFLRFSGSSSAVMQPIVGAVSQAAGLPTGALIESGLNSNGAYIRWADGTQICSQAGSINPTMATASGALFSNDEAGQYVWTFPAAFVAIPTMSSGVSRATFDSRRVFITYNGDNPVTATQAKLSFASTTSAPSLGLRLHAVAFGRWF